MLGYRAQRGFPSLETKSSRAWARLYSRVYGEGFVSVFDFA